MYLYLLIFHKFQKIINLSIISINWSHQLGYMLEYKKSKCDQVEKNAITKTFSIVILDTRLWFLGRWKREKMVNLAVFLTFCRFSPLLRNNPHFSTVEGSSTSSRYPWVVLVLIDSSKIFRGATRQSRHEIWCSPQEQGRHRSPCWTKSDSDRSY